MEICSFIVLILKLKKEEIEDRKNYDEINIPF